MQTRNKHSIHIAHNHLISLHFEFAQANRNISMANTTLHIEHHNKQQ